MSAKKRRITFRAYDNEAKKVVEKLGTFHQWGESYEQINVHDGIDIAKWTYAICEAEDGRVFKADPGDIIFLEKEVTT